MNFKTRFALWLSPKYFDDREKELDDLFQKAQENLRDVEKQQKEVNILNHKAQKNFSGSEQEANRRFALLVAKMDPFEPLMKQFHGIFSEEFEHPEEKLDPRGQLGMKMWAYSQSKDPHFKYFMDWIANTQGNETLKRAACTPERIMYGRAQISGISLIKKEVGRLSNLYEEELEKNKVQKFETNLTVE